MNRALLAIAVLMGAIGGIGSIVLPISQQTASSPELAASSSTKDVNPTENLTAARQLAWKAAKLVQHPPHAVDTWREARLYWRQAIRLLEAVPAKTSTFAQAQELLKTYRKNYTAIDDRFTQEQTARRTLDISEDLAWQAAISGQHPSHPIKSWQYASRRWQEAIVLLESIPVTTSAHKTAQQKLVTYRQNVATIRQRLALELKMIALMRQFSDNAASLNRLSVQALSRLSLDQVGILYEDYAALVQRLKGQLDQVAAQPGATQHPVYPALTRAIADYEAGLQLWQAYLNQPRETFPSVYDDLLEQYVSIAALTDPSVVQRYRLNPSKDGKQISLKYSLWEIWRYANQRIQTAAEQMTELPAVTHPNANLEEHAEN